MMSKADILVKDIIKEKFELEKLGKNPRLVLLGIKDFELLENEWIESIKKLPWGDSLELELRKNRSNVFLGDGSLCGLWVVKVETIEGFEVR